MQLSLNQPNYSYYFDLAKRLHESRNHMGAWENWIVAHGLQPDNFHVKAANEILSYAINAEIYKHDLPDQGEDLIFILGMPRSGTTLLEQILCTHDDIEGHGELKGMVTLLDVALLEHDWKLNDELISQFQSHYRSQLGNKKKRYHVDKMPRNFIGIFLIKSIFPKCKIIQTHRDRFSTCMSIYASNFGEFAPYAHRWETLNLFYDHYIKVTEARKSSLYKVIYEDVIEHFDVTIKGVCDYLDIPFTGKEHTFYKNKNIVVTCSKDQVKKPLYHNANKQWDPYREIIGDISQPLSSYLNEVFIK